MPDNTNNTNNTDNMLNMFDNLGDDLPEQDDQTLPSTDIDLLLQLNDVDVLAVGIDTKDYLDIRYKTLDVANLQPAQVVTLIKLFEFYKDPEHQQLYLTQTEIAEFVMGNKSRQPTVSRVLSIARMHVAQGHSIGNKAQYSSVGVLPKELLDRYSEIQKAQANRQTGLDTGYVAQEYVLASREYTKLTKELAAARQQNELLTAKITVLSEQINAVLVKLATAALIPTPTVPPNRTQTRKVDKSKIDKVYDAIRTMHDDVAPTISPAYWEQIAAWNLRTVREWPTAQIGLLLNVCVSLILQSNHNDEFIKLVGQELTRMHAAKLAKEDETL